MKSLLPPYNTTTKAMAAALFANGVFGLSFLFSKVALNTVTPFTLLALRFLLAFLVMNLLLLTRRIRISLKGKPILPLLLLGLFQPVLYYICENYGVQMTTATFSSVMIALIPIAALFGGIFLLREWPSWVQVLFSLLSIAGVIIMAVQTGGDGTVQPLGVVLLVGAVVASVLFNATSRRLSGSFSPVERTYVMFLLGSVVFTTAALMENHGDVPALFGALADPTVLTAVLFLGLVCSVAAFLALNYANTHLPLARAMSFANATMVVSVFAGVVFLHEHFDGITLLAAAMILVGIWGVQRFKLKVEN